MCLYANSGCTYPEGECMGLCTLTRRVRAGGPPPEEPIEFHPEEIRRDERDFAAKCAAYIVLLFAVIGSVSFLVGVFV